MRALLLISVVVLAALLPLSESQAQEQVAAGCDNQAIVAVDTPRVRVNVERRTCRPKCRRDISVQIERYARPVRIVQPIRIVQPVQLVEPIESWVVCGRGPCGIFPRSWRYYRYK
jgi:hypothetical protein